MAMFRVGNLMAVLSAALVASAIAAVAPRVVTLTVDDTMKYNVATIEAKPGEELIVRLVSKGTLPAMAGGHNFVLVKKDTNLDAFTTAAVMARDTEYILAKFAAAVLAKTKLVGPGETVEVRFKAPTAPGSYPYFCSFPGHYAAGAKGMLIVK